MSFNVSRTVQKTVTAKNAAVDTAASLLDTALTTAMNAIITTPPSGYQAGSIQIKGNPDLIYDSTNYVFSQSFFYNTVLSS